MRIDLDIGDLQRLLDWYEIVEVEMQNKPEDDSLMKYIHTAKRLLEDEMRRAEENEN